MAGASFTRRLTDAYRALRGLPSGQRMYSAARASRLSGDWNASLTSADSEISNSLRQLIARSRAACRDIPYAKRAKQLIVNNVIGSAIGFQAQVYNSRGELNKRINDDIETAHEEWAQAEYFHTGGRLNADAFDRALLDQVVEAGGVLVRDHFRSFGGSKIPFAQELIEVERLADDFIRPFQGVASGHQVRMGVELDEFHRPVAYFIRKRHPGEYRFNFGETDIVERVPAEEITHLALIDRWPQTRGVPWFHTVLSNIKDTAGYVEAEITRARIQACTVGAIETPEDSSAFGETQEDGSVEMEVAPGVLPRLNPGEKLSALATNSPNPSADPFLRFLLREFSAGTGPSYESISRDYSQSNFSSSRLALLDDRDLWRVLQSWFIRSYRAARHRKWLKQAVYSQAIPSIGIAQYVLDPAKFEAVRFRPRGWGWVDPTKEVEAFRSAVRAGFMTLQDVVATSGADIEELFDQRKKEVEMADEAGLVFDTNPAQVADSGIAQPDEKPPDAPGATSTDPETNPAPSRVFRIKQRN